MGKEDGQDCKFVFYGSELEVINIAVVTFHCPQLGRPLGHPQLQGRLGSVGGWLCALEEKGNGFENNLSVHG